MVRKLDSYRKQYEQAARKWQRAHAKYWARYENTPYVAGGRTTDMTVGQVALTNRSEREAFGDPLSKPKPFSEIRSTAEARRLIKAMNYESSPSGQKRRRAQLRANTNALMAQLDMPQLQNLLSVLSDDQLEHAYRTTDFFSRGWAHYSGFDDMTEGGFLEENLIATVLATVSELSPAQKKKIKSRQQRLAKIEKTSRERESYNQKIAAKGRTRDEKIRLLRQWGVQPVGSPSDWYTRYL